MEPLRARRGEDLRGLARELGIAAIQVDRVGTRRLRQRLAQSSPMRGAASTGCGREDDATDG